MWIISKDYYKFYEGYKNILASQKLLEMEFELKIRHRIEKLKAIDTSLLEDWENKKKAYQLIFDSLYP